MKKLAIKIITACVLLFIFMSCGFMWGYLSADYKALKSVCNSDQTDILELVIEHDYNVEILSAHYDYENGFGYLVVKNESEDIFAINVKVKKVEPFRYEWVEVVL